jgi:hypothetical protein
VTAVMTLSQKERKTSELIKIISLIRLAIIQFASQLISTSSLSAGLITPPNVS